MALPTRATRDFPGRSLWKYRDATKDLEIWDGLSSDPDLDVARGLVPGMTSEQFAGQSDFIGESFGTVWDIDDDFVFPTGDESWELLSDSASDAAAGTGARTVLVEGLDTDFLEVEETKNLNGTTPVVLTRTDWNSIRRITVIDSGSNQSNVGNVTLRVTGGGLTRSTILPDRGQSFNGFFMVPAGKNAYIRNLDPIVPKGQDMKFRINIKIFGTNTNISGGDFDVYQSLSSIVFITIPVFPEKTTFEVTAKSTNANSTGFLGVNFFLEDNTLGNSVNFSRALM